MKIIAGAVQYNHRPRDKACNLARIEHLVREAADASAKLLLFPEMCITGYWHVIDMERDQIRALSETVFGPSIQVIKQLSSAVIGD
jgi:predicted amidohydrolase